MFLKSTVILNQASALNNKVVVDTEAHSRELSVPWETFFAFEFDKVYEDFVFCIAGQFCLKVFETPTQVSTVDKTKKSAKAALINPYMHGETALSSEELIFRCGILAGELESFRVMPGVRVKRISQQICTMEYDRDAFEGHMYQIQFTEYKYTEDLQDYELSHYWEPP